jgi:protein-tyrosine-phosphatase
MAEALARSRSGGTVEAHSAGSHPKPLHPDAVRAMREVHGIDLAGQRSKPVDVYADQRFDRVVSLCDKVREVCPELTGEPEAVHWSIPDPNQAGSYAAFRDVAVELGTRVGFLLADLSATDPSATTPQEEP